MKRYFLSYARADEQFALRLAQDLKAAEIDVWVDQLDILPSQLWDRALEAALQASAGVVVILSPRSAASENVLDEVGFALDRGKDVVPVLYERCEIPLRLNRIQRIDFTQDYGSALERCKSVLKAATPGMGAQTAAPCATPSSSQVSQPPREPAQQQHRVVQQWEAKIIHQAEQDLALYVGPIARQLAQTAAAQATTVEALYQLLAASISDQRDRAAFLRGVANAPDTRTSVHSEDNAPAAGTLSASLLEAVGRELTVYLGPISRHLVEEESRESDNLEDLYVRLSNRLASAEERAAFLKRVRGIS